MPAARGQRAILSALRENLNLLHELTLRYDAPTAKGRSPTLVEVHSPSDAAAFLKRDMEGLLQEQLRVLVLDTKNRVRAVRTIYKGSVNQALVRPCEIFRDAVIENLPAVIVAHSHPSGDPTPSPEDVALTGRLIEAGKLLAVDLLDHIVVGREGTVSLRTRGLPHGVTWPG